MVFLPAWVGEAGADEHRGEAERVVPMEKVPGPVKDLLLAEAEGNTIEDIELSSHGFAQIYEADWTVGDRETEVRVLYFCKVIARSMEMTGNKDEENDDDD